MTYCWQKCQGIREEKEKRKEIHKTEDVEEKMSGGGGGMNNLVPPFPLLPADLEML